jgi:hypothetical protein
MLTEDGTVHGIRHEIVKDTAHRFSCEVVAHLRLSHLWRLIEHHGMQMAECSLAARDHLVAGRLVLVLRDRETNVLMEVAHMCICRMFESHVYVLRPV